MKTTLTLQELVDDLRSIGVKTSKATCKAMIQQGKYPFALSCECESSTHFEIYVKAYTKWKEENIK